MAKQSYRKNIPESSNAATITTSGPAKLPPLYPSVDIKHENTRYLLEMKNTIRQLVHKNQEMERQFNFKAHELEDTNAQLHACILKLEGNKLSRLMIMSRVIVLVDTLQLLVQGGPQGDL